MRPTLAAKAVKTCVEIKRPVMLHGSPGVGKSDVIRSVARDMQIDLIDLRLSQLDPVDLRGIPCVNKKTNQTSWAPPDFLPTSGAGILFLDEMNQAAQATQAASYQLLLDRRLGDYVLPKDWAIVAAGNRSSDRAIVNQMGSALKNRLVHIDYEVSKDDWEEWAVKSGLHVSVLGFIRFRPDALNEFDDRAGDQDKEKARQQKLRDAKAFATPRTWEFVSQLITKGLDASIELELIQGTVGEGATAEFLAYMQHYRNLPDLQEILRKPKSVKVPTEPGVLYALSTGLAALAEPKYMDNIIEYTLQLPQDFQVMLIKDCVMRNAENARGTGFQRWTKANLHVLV